MQLLISWLILAASVWFTAYVLPGVRVKSFGGAIWAAAIFGVLNALLGWLFFTVFAVATLGLAVLLAFLTRVVINAILLSITASVTDVFEIDGFKWAMIASLMMSVLGSLAQWMFLR